MSVQESLWGDVHDSAKGNGGQGAGPEPAGGANPGAAAEVPAVGTPADPRTGQYGLDSGGDSSEPLRSQGAGPLAHAPAGPAGADPGSGGVLHAAGRDSGEEIEQRAEALAQLKPPAEGYLEEMARLETARQMAEMQVIREMILVDPENLESDRQLLG